jgi:hypothetical protein
MDNELSVPGSESVPMNGRDLAVRILEHPEGGVAGLLRLKGYINLGNETVWLEFKASLNPKDGRYEPGENKDDYRWNFAEAVIAMANTVGGVVLLGLDDRAQVVGLAASDWRETIQRKGYEAFNREVVQSALLCQGWKTGRKGNLYLSHGCESQFENLFEIRTESYQNQPIVAILVSPTHDNELLEIEEELNNRKRNIVYIRQPGDVGQNRGLQSYKDIDEYKRSRRLRLSEKTYNNLWQKFLSETSLQQSNKNNIKLVGMSKQQKILEDTISSWIKGNSIKPIVILGEEGTGKTALIGKVLNLQQPRPKVINISGSSYELDPDRFYIYVLAQLFSIDFNYDGKIIENLRDFCSKNSLIFVRNLLNFISQSDQKESLIRSPIAGIPKKTSDFDSAEINISSEFKVSGKSEFYLELWRVLDVFSTVESTKIIVWIEDAQRYENVNSTGLNLLMRVASEKNNHILLIAEFRAEHTRDINRIKERYCAYCSNPIISSDLRPEEINQLIAVFLDKPSAEIPRAFSKHIYSNTGGNPKITIDFLKYLEECGILKRHSDIESLLSPRIFDIKIPSELKTIYKNRMDHFDLSKDHLEILSIIACSPDYEVSVSLIALILGESISEQVEWLIDMEILRQCESYDEWKVRFAHLAARDACLEILQTQDKDFRESLKSKVLVVLSEKTTKDKVFQALDVICRELCCIAGDGIHLAEKIVRPVLNARTEDIPKLEKYSSVLIKVISNENYCVLFVRSYLRIKIKELKSLSRLDNEEYFHFAKQFWEISSTGFEDKFRFFCIIIAQCMAKSITDDQQRINQVAEFFSKFRYLINTQDISKEIIEQTLSSVARSFWRNVPKEFTKITILYQKIRRSDIDFKVDDYAKISSNAQARYIHLKALKNEMHNQAELDEDFSLVKRLLSCYLNDSYDHNNLIDHQKDLILFSELLIKTHIWQVSDNYQSFEDVEKILKQVESFCVEFQNTAFDDLEDLLVQAHVVFARAIKNNTIKSIETIKNCERIVSSKWLIYLVSERILIAYRAGISFNGEDFNFLKNLLFNEKTWSKYNTEKINIIMDAISILNLDSKDLINQILLNWIDGFLNDPDMLLDVVRYLEYFSINFNLDTRQVFSLIRKKPIWSKVDQIAISVFEKRCENNLEDQKYKSNNHKKPIKEIRNRFDTPLKIYHDLDIFDKDIRKIIGFIVMDMINAILAFPKIKEKDDVNRIQAIRNVIENITIEKDIKRNTSYWNARWKLQVKYGDSKSALSECEKIISEININNSDRKLRIFLLANAARLATPYLYGFEEFSGQFDRNNISISINYLRQWLELEPESEACTRYLLNICQHCSEDEKRWIVDKVSYIADFIEKQGNIKDARWLYYNLVFEFHRLKDRASEVLSAEKAYKLACRELHTTLGDKSRFESNLLYVNLISALENNDKIEDLILNFEPINEKVKGSDLQALVSYNFAIMYLLTGNFEEGIFILYKLPKEQHCKSELRENVAWLIIFINDTNTRNYIEVPNIWLGTAMKLSGGLAYKSLGETDIAKMWISASLENLQSQELSSELAQILIYSAEQVKIKIPDYLVNTCHKNFHNLEVRAKQLLQNPDYILDKNSLCPCKSGRRYKDCCRSLFLF